MAADARQKAAFRRWARENHPDLGGDPAAFAAGLKAAREGRWDEFAATAPAQPEPRHRRHGQERTTVYVHRSARGVVRLISAARRWNDRRRQPPRVR